MDFDFSWLLLGFPIAFVLGWLASRFDLRQLKLENRQAPKAYFRGLNFLLNEQQDQAIDAFIEAVQNDPDTQELHFALGNLFRRRGEYQRAVRVHEHLLGRGDLSRADRERAQHALAQDFLRAGLLDRAEAALQKLEGTRYENEARLSLLAIYERSREWTQAAAVAEKLDAAGQASHSTRRSHYLCEQAAERLAKGDDTAAAAELLRQAVALAPTAPRPAIDTAALQWRMGQPDAAFDTLMALSERAPLALPLCAGTLQQAAVAAGRTGEALALLERRYAEQPSIDLLEAIIALGGLPVRADGGTPVFEPASPPAPETGVDAAPQQVGTTPRDGYIAHLTRQPSLVAASRWLAGETFANEQFHPQVQRALEQATRPLMRYRCAACGFEAHQYFWHCPGCQAWDSYPPRRVEEL
ncbi:MAG TPA: lipopolysaccharide assembly protein LapB [Variovorax sp.]|nr:lipopolysaccharide assembly protein LapB [Variovorax sp.]